MEQHEACPQGAKRMLGACRQNRHNATCAVGKEVGGGETRVVGEEEEECDKMAEKACAAACEVMRCERLK